MATLLFNIEKEYVKNNSQKLLEQLEYICTQKQILDFIRALISDSREYHITEQAN